MGTLVASGTIETIREIWWDIRPHPGFGTVELRICDGLPTLQEVGAVAALSQCLVDQLNTQLDRGYQLPRPNTWVQRENKWRAARHGLDAELILDEHGTTRPLREAIAELVHDLSPLAERLGCAAELDDVLTHPRGRRELRTPAQGRRPTTAATCARWSTACWPRCGPGIRERGS